MISNETGIVRSEHGDVIPSACDPGEGGKVHDGPTGREGVGNGRARTVRALAAAIVAAVEEGDLVAASALARVLLEYLGSPGGDRTNGR